MDEIWDLAVIEIAAVVRSDAVRVGKTAGMVCAWVSIPWSTAYFSTCAYGLR